MMKEFDSSVTSLDTIKKMELPGYVPPSKVGFLEHV